MSDDATTAEAPAVEVDAAIKEIGDKIAALTLLQAKQLTDYLKDAYGIEPAAGGAVVMAGLGVGGAEAGAPGVDAVSLTGSTGAGAKKLQVIKVVRAARSDLGLKEAKALVDTAPKPVLEGVSKEDADKWTKQLEEVGATIAVEPA